MNKKAVEGLPLKYIIIALIAVLVIAIALEMVGVLKGGILSAITNINTTMSRELAKGTLELKTGQCATDGVDVTLKNAGANIGSGTWFLAVYSATDGSLAGAGDSTLSINTGETKTVEFDLSLDSGDYNLEVTAPNGGEIKGSCTV
jgi:hypothetical protein